jgi:flagellar assembly factor FliW
VNVMTTRFGEVDIDVEKIIKIPDSLLGFTEKRFIVLLPDNYGQFFWLQSVDNPALAFVVTDPLSFIQDYEVKLTSEEYKKLKLTPESEVILLSLVTMAQDVKDITINLQGPIVVNPEKMVAKQIVLEDGKYKTKHPLFANPTLLGPPLNKENGKPAVARKKITRICCNL